MTVRNFGLPGRHGGQGEEFLHICDIPLLMGKVLLWAGEVNTFMHLGNCAASYSATRLKKLCESA